MKISFLVLLLSGYVFATTTPPNVIYGEDNRVDTINSPVPSYRELAKSTAAMIYKTNITIRGNSAELTGRSLGEFMKLCEKERFFFQPTAANCSGFLVSPDTIVTAGHCMQNQSECANAAWVFNYKVDHENQTSVSVSKDHVYNCTRIVKQANDGNLDFAVIKLDRTVTAVNPVRVAKVDVQVGFPLVMIGHPSGLPQKISDGAQILSKSALTFRANLDAFRINSGSAVFNTKTGELVGILVNGANDYRRNKDLNCNEVDTLPDSSTGEGISSFLQFKDFL